MIDLDRPKRYVNMKLVLDVQENISEDFSTYLKNGRNKPRIKHFIRFVIGEDRFDMSGNNRLYNNELLINHFSFLKLYERDSKFLALRFFKGTGIIYYLDNLLHVCEKDVAGYTTTEIIYETLKLSL